MKTIIISNNDSLNNKLGKINVGEQSIEIVGIFPVGVQAMQAIKEHHPAFVLMHPDVAYELNEIKHKEEAATASRQYISASTHHGVQLLPVAAVYFFQAEHKYVVAHHEKGELLLNDSLASLEKEFPTIFIRIHRNTLVAKEYIKALEKDEHGHWQIILTTCSKKLIVSRRQLAIVRKCIHKHSITKSAG